MRCRVCSETCPEKLEQISECTRLGRMVVRPESAELAVEPDAVQILQAALEMRIAFNVIEQIASLRLR